MKDKQFPGIHFISVKILISRKLIMIMNKNWTFIMIVLVKTICDLIQVLRI